MKSRITFYQKSPDNFASCRHLHIRGDGCGLTHQTVWNPQAYTFHLFRLNPFGPNGDWIYELFACVGRCRRRRRTAERSGHQQSCESANASQIAHRSVA